MLYKLDDYWIDELKKAAKLLNPARKKDAEPTDIKTIEGDKYIEELDYELDHKIDELQDLQNDLESNYTRRTAWEDSGMSYHDFI